MPFLRRNRALSYATIISGTAAAKRAPTRPTEERPACIMLTIRRKDDGTQVLLLPTTHSPPKDGQIGVEFPPRVKQHLGLDQERSWVIVTEGNLDLWPNPDLKRIPGQHDRFDFGLLPPRLFRGIRDAFLDAHRARRVQLVKRDV